jgi:hypothetical protein
VIRFSEFVDNANGVSLGVTDPSEHVSAGDVRVEHVTVARATGAGISIQSSYPATGVVLRHNVVTLASAPNRSDAGPNVYRLWPYDDPPPAGLVTGSNCFYAPASDDAFRIGASYSDLAGFGAYDATSVWADPEFGSEDLELGPGSACRLDPVPGARPD